MGRPPPAPIQLDAGKLPLNASLNLQNLPIPQFANAVFSGILKLNVSLDAQVQSRNDLVSLVSGQPLSANEIFAAASGVLRSYGIAVNQFEGLVRLIPANSPNGGNIPEIYRARSTPEFPSNLRPVFAWVNVSQVSVNSVRGLIGAAFGSKLQIFDDAQNNALLISGQSDVVASAQEAIRLFDQPAMRGRYTVRINPMFWTAEELSTRLQQIMRAQGYTVGTKGDDIAPILVLPVPPINAVFVFASKKEALDQVLRWARELDQQANSKRGSGSGYLSYYLKNTDAASVAKTLSSVMGDTAAAGTSGTSGTGRGVPKVVVNPATNSLIIRASPNEYQDLFSLMQELDRPARSALVTATVAEVRLTDSTNIGFNWLLAQFTSHGFLVDIGTATSTALSNNGSGLNVRLSRSAGDPRALLSLLATDGKVKILSNPSIITRSGESASLVVGQEVPILTSQVSNSSTLGSNGVLQTIQYRSTGIQLNIKPVVRSGGRIDVDVSQEVSAAQVNDTGVDNTPLILNRRLETKMTVADGVPTLMGGLISSNISNSRSGIPWLKDIPIIGNVFTTGYSSTEERTELVLLLTVYAIQDDYEAQEITDAFRRQFPWAADKVGGSKFWPDKPLVTGSSRTTTATAPESSVKYEPIASPAEEPPLAAEKQPAASAAKKVEKKQTPAWRKRYELKEPSENTKEQNTVEDVNTDNQPQPRRFAQPQSSGDPTQKSDAAVANNPAHPPEKAQSPEEFLKNLLKNAKPVGDNKLKRELEQIH